MKPIIEKYIGEEAFEEKLAKLSGNAEFEEVFKSFLANFLIELEEDNAIEEDDTPATLLDVPNDYIESYVESRLNGFSKVWSTTRANLKIMQDKNNTVIRCYEEVASIDKNEALKDLQVFCKLKKGDKRYTDFLIDYVINNGYSERPVEELASEFSKIYKKQLETGKSEIYADKYASLIAEDHYHEIYCEDYAFIYDQALAQGKSEEYAREYAEKYAHELVDVKRRAGIADDEESLDFARAKAKAYIYGWEYAFDNNLQEKKKFMECYSNTYLNAVYSDDRMNKEKLEELVLRKALEKFEKRNKVR